MNFPTISSLEDLMKLDADPNVAVAKFYNYIILTSDSPQEAFSQAIRFGRLFVEVGKWQKIESHYRNFSEAMPELTAWVRGGLSLIPSEKTASFIVFDSYTLKSKGYCLQQALQDSLKQVDIGKIYLTKNKWCNEMFDDVRLLTSSSRPLTGKSFKFAFHAGWAAYTCYGKMLFDVMSCMGNISSWSNRTLEFYINVNYPMFLGRLNSSGIWIAGDPKRILEG